MRLLIALVFLTLGLLGLSAPRKVQDFYLRQYRKYPDNRRMQRAMLRTERPSFVAWVRIGGFLATVFGLLAFYAIVVSKR